MNVHHHSPLAGVSAAGIAVLVCGAALLGVWHQISGPVGLGVKVAVLAAVVFAVVRVGYEIAFMALRLRYHVQHPEVLPLRTVRAHAEVIPAQQPAVPVAAAAPVAALAPPVTNHWHLPESAEGVTAMVRAAQPGWAHGTTEEIR